MRDPATGAILKPRPSRRRLPGTTHHQDETANNKTNNKVSSDTPLIVGIVSERRHVRWLATKLREFSRVGQVKLLGGDSGLTIPSSVDLVILRPAGCSHGADHTAREWRRGDKKHRTLLVEDSQQRVLEDVEKLIALPEETPEATEFSSLHAACKTLRTCKWDREALRLVMGAGPGGFVPAWRWKAPKSVRDRCTEYNAVRHALPHLVPLGLVTRGLAFGSRGRPPASWTLTDRGAEVAKKLDLKAVLKPNDAVDLSAIPSAIASKPAPVEPSDEAGARVATAGKEPVASEALSFEAISDLLISLEVKLFQRLEKVEARMEVIAGLGQDRVTQTQLDAVEHEFSQEITALHVEVRKAPSEPSEAAGKAAPLDLTQHSLGAINDALVALGLPGVVLCLKTEG